MYDKLSAVDVDEIGKWMRHEFPNASMSAEDWEKTVTAVHRSRLFREEIQTDLTGLPRRVIAFQHELMGKYLAARHLRRCVLQDSGLQFDIKVLSSYERWLDVFFFLIDELESRTQLNSLLCTLLDGGTPQQLRLVSYARGTKPAGWIDREVRELYDLAKLDADLSGTPAAKREKNVSFRQAPVEH